MLVPVGNVLYYSIAKTQVYANNVNTSNDPDEMLQNAWVSYLDRYKELDTEDKLDIKNAAYKGSKKPVVEIVEFADFLCGHCKTLTMRLKKVLEEYGAVVKVYFKHYPLDSTCNPSVPRKGGSCNLAYLGHCIKLQSQNKFWDYAYYLFENQAYFHDGSIKKEDLIKEISRGLNINKLNQCITAQSTKDAILNDVKNGDELGVKGTPTVFINGKKISGVLTFPNDFFLKKLIDVEIANLAGGE